MADNDIIRFKSSSIAELAGVLKERFYQKLLDICTEAAEIALQLRAKEIDGLQDTEPYTMLCVNFTKQLRQYQEQKLDTIVPYLISLSDKQQNNHDCGNCSHNCQINHGMQVAFLKESHEFAKVQLLRLNNLAVPLETKNVNDELYHALRDKMFLIERYLLESRFLEETILIPQVVSAQQAINVQPLA